VTRPTRRRRGFTLVELMVALVVTGMIALAAYGALDAGASTRARVQGVLGDREGALLARALLDDALRHAADASGPALVFAHAESAGDVLDFVSRGVAPADATPLGASPRWRVQVGPDAAGDVLLVATPLDAPGPALRSALGGVRALRVSTLGPDGWTRAAADVVRVPDVVRVELVAAPGSAPLPPVVARTSAGGVR